MDSVRDEPSIMTGWRNKTKDFFAENGGSIEILDPCRRPHSEDCTLSDKEIFELDMIDVKRSDLLLADCRLHEGRSQFGTPCEIISASYFWNKPVIGWYNKDEGYREKSVFQNVLISNMFPSLEEALEHILDFYACDI